jgi:hypothetical protein
MDELTYGPLGHSHRSRDLRAAAALDRGRKQRLALPRRQAREFAQRLSRPHPPRHHLLQHIQRDGADLEWQLARSTPRCARRGVAEDLEQPPPQMPHLGARVERRIGVQERLLDDVLRAPVPVEPSRRGEQLPAVALDDRRERPLVAGARERHQLFIGVCAQWRPR